MNLSGGGKQAERKEIEKPASKLHLRAPYNLQAESGYINDDQDYLRSSIFFVETNLPAWSR